MRGSMRASPASSTVCSTCRSARRTRMSLGRSVQAPSPIAARQPATLRSTFARCPHSSHSVLSWPCVSMRASTMAWMRWVFVVMSCSHVERSLRVASMARLRTPAKRPPPARIDSGRLHVGRTSHVSRFRTRDAPVPRVVEREQREPRKRRRDANTRLPKGRGRPFGGRGTTVEQETGWPAKVRSSVRRRPERRYP